VSIQISLDAFPAKVTLPSGAELSPVRAYLVDGRVEIYHVVGGTVDLYYSRDVRSIDGRSVLSGINVLVDDGEVRIKKASGCGCGHPLKSYNPWPGESRTLVRL